MSWWELLKIGVDKGIGNMSEQEKADLEAQKTRGRDPNMTYAKPDAPTQGNGIQAAQNLDRMAGWGDGSVKMNPLMSQPAEMEKGMGNAPTAVGGFSLQPSHVDSSQQSAPSSGMQNYLNYMKYRGGYR